MRVFPLEPRQEKRLLLAYTQRLGGAFGKLTYRFPMGHSIRQVRDWTDGRGADVACDLVGFPPVVPEGIEMLRYGGTYLEIGCISRGRTVELDPSSLVWGSKRIVGVVMYDPWVIPRALEFLERTRARFPFDRLVSHTFPLERIDDAFRQAEWYNRETAATRITRAALAP